MFVVILHERLTSGDGRFLIVTELARDFRLQGEVQNIGRALICVMQLGPHPQQEIIGRVDPLPIARAQPILADEMGRGEGAFLETGDPQEDFDNRAARRNLPSRSAPGG